MIGGISVYEVVSAEQKVLEQRLDRMRHYHEAKAAFEGSSRNASGGLRGIARSVRDLFGSFGGQQVSGKSAAA
jgi:hypothetical protein